MGGKKRAFVVGINEYTDRTFNTLKFAENDARALTSVLEDEKFGEFDEVVCLDHKVTKRELESKLVRMMNDAETEDLVLVYFAGHGMLDISQQLCLVTADTEADILFWTAVPLENVNRMINESRCRSVILMMDCCYSGQKNHAFRGSALLDSLNKFSEDQGAATRIVISAAQGEEVAREMDGFDHGVFTHYILEGLRAEADQDQDGYVSLDELFAYVSRQVLATTNNHQRPSKYPADRITSIKLAKNLSTLEAVQKNDIERTDRLWKLTRIWNDESLKLTDEIYHKASSVLRHARSPGDRKKFSLVKTFLDQPVSEETTKEFQDVFIMLESILKDQPEPLKLQNSLESLRDQSTPNVATQPDRANPTNEVKVVDRGPQSPQSDTRPSRLANPAIPGGERTAARDRVFISYSHADEKWLKKLIIQLDPFKQRGLVVWTDKDIEPGDKWHDKIQENLARTKVAVLLVSATFLASEFVNMVELKTFLEDQGKLEVTILPVLVSACPWEETIIERFQFAYPTEKGLDFMESGESPIALAEIAKAINKAARPRNAAAVPN